MRGTERTGDAATAAKATGWTPSVPGGTVRAVNRLTARWAAALPAGARGTVLSAAAVWPLLGLLAEGAAGPARAELEDAVGMPADRAAEAARGLVTALDRIRGSAAAIGLWARPGLPLRERWVAGLPAASFGRFSGDDTADRAALDAWAAERTGGLIPRMPVEVDADVLLVLAAAQTLRTRWLQPFWDFEWTPESGPWAGRSLVGLRRWTSLLDRVGVAETPAGPLTVLRVLGDTGVDVHLLLGAEGAAPGAVLAAGVGVVGGAHPVVTGDVLPLGEPGPGLRVEHVRSSTREHELGLGIPAFDLTAEHDLLASAAVFGLGAATDRDHGHFPGVSDSPLAIAQAKQAGMARFTRDGFEAAAVTVIGAAAGAGVEPRLRYRVRRVRLDVDRPFGFLAVHRTSRLVLSAGWVTDPVGYTEAPYAYDEDEDEDEDDWS
ncbi:serpin family protein [Streptomyces sp. NRRL F-5727]|uniref:serpin family protein n=1 Tax=Streptomyces sp. NRRL F-5727 TaxID=1463871 RepID=UPI00099C55EC|nr:serpin family protein [Streptomyces sp. NRRL F-5727]